MHRFYQSLLRHLDALIFCSAFLLPFASGLIQAALYQTTAIRMRTGDAVFHLFGTGVVGLIGFLMFGFILYKSVKNNRPIPIASILLTASAVSLTVAACILALVGKEGFCGGVLSDCGRWM
jgi:hypothetical protein